MHRVFWVVLIGLLASVANAGVISTTVHSADVHGLDGLIVPNDLIEGMLGTELPGDRGWHPANTNAADQLAAFTDGAGMGPSGVTGLLNDFPPDGLATKIVQYDLGAPVDITKINVLSGNNSADGRVFSTTVVDYSTDGGATFMVLGYFQSDPSGTLNNAANPQFKSTLVSIFDDSSNTLIAGATNLEFYFFGVDNTQGQMRDPYGATNPFTGLSDGLSAPNTSPLILEIDVVPEPATLAMLALSLLLWRRRRAAVA
jgi:hypothetical protein